MMQGDRESMWFDNVPGVARWQRKVGNHIPCKTKPETKQKETKP